MGLYIIEAYNIGFGEQNHVTHVASVVVSRFEKATLMHRSTVSNMVIRRKLCCNWSHPSITTVPLPILLMFDLSMAF